jgi:hypothetical protein
MHKYAYNHHRKRRPKQATSSKNWKTLSTDHYFSGILEVSEFRKRKQLEKNKEYAPWIARKMTEAFALSLHP